MKRTPFSLFVCLSLSMLTPAHPRVGKKAQPQAPANSSYENTPEGLRGFLEDILAAAKKGDKHRLALLIKSTEVPNCDAWLHQHYPADTADSWMGLCDPKALGPNEESLQEQFMGFAKQDGEILTRVATNDPAGSRLAPSDTRSTNHANDSYFASWRLATEPKDAKGDPIGYFGFIDGAFRWDSGAWFPKIKFASAKIVPAKLIKRVEPVYPVDAAAQHITGTVRVYYVIGGDGKVYNAHALSGEGLSEDSSLRKAAEDAVLEWKYQPATMDGKPIQTNAVTVDLKFSPNG